jgi:hypothetical protein
MRRISLAGSDVAVTDDRIAALVLEYAKQLGRAGTTDTVDLPVAADGGPDEASLLLGPASQIAVTANDRIHLERIELPAVDAVVSDLRHRIRELTGERERPVAIHGEDRSVAPPADPLEVFPDFDALRPADPAG